MPGETTKNTKVSLQGVSIVYPIYQLKLGNAEKDRLDGWFVELGWFQGSVNYHLPQHPNTDVRVQWITLEHDNDDDGPPMMEKNCNDKLLIQDFFNSNYSAFRDIDWLNINKRKKKWLL